MGASTPRWIRQANAATRPVAIHLPSCRQRPTGIRVCRAPRPGSRPGSRPAGTASPSRPNCRVARPRTAAGGPPWRAGPPADPVKKPMNTTRWRKRRNASNAITVAQRSAPTMPIPIRWRLQSPPQAGHAGEAQPGQPPHHRVVPDGDRHAQAAPAGPKATLASVTRTPRRPPTTRRWAGYCAVAEAARRWDADEGPDRRTASSPDRADPTSPGSTGRGWTPSAHPATSGQPVYTSPASMPTRSKRTDHDLSIRVQDPIVKLTVWAVVESPPTKTSIVVVSMTQAFVRVPGAGRPRGSAASGTRRRRRGRDVGSP